nr:hypothetical protein [uncultured Cellulosilyticum sp.]
MTITIGSTVGVQDMCNQNLYRIGKVKEIISENCCVVETKEIEDGEMVFYDFIAYTIEIDYCKGAKGGN